MATDQSLATLLRALQIAADQQDVFRLLGTAATLLTLLHNPLNITLLSAQLLSAPAIWDRPDGDQSATRILGIFNSATAKMLQHEESSRKTSSFALRSALNKEDWIIAVVNGADERSPRWRHLLLLGGVLLGLERHNHQAISTALREKLESAMTSALNLALRELGEGSDRAINALVITTNYVFPVLSDAERNHIDYDLLVPQLCWALFFSGDGLHFGYFLSSMDADIKEDPDRRFGWSSKSSSFEHIKRMTVSPLVASLGSLSQIIAHSVEHLQNVDLLRALIVDVSAFSRSLGVQWRQNKLSEIDAHEEAAFLSAESLQNSLPMLWQTLKSLIFCIIIILRPLLGRILVDRRIPTDDATFIASQTLQILRNLHFISFRSGASSFSQYAFVYFIAIDILSHHPDQAESCLRDIMPVEIGSISQHPLDRCHDLYFLDLAENFSLFFTPEVNEELLIRASMPYLGVGGDQRLLQTFEAAHSVILAVFLAPQNFNLVIRHVRGYIDALFQVFPHNISPRQFRMAVKTLIRVTSPPSVISEREPLLSSILLQLVHQRSESEIASPHLPPPPSDIIDSEPASAPEGPFLTEQVVMILTLIDALPYINLEFLEEWLDITAASISHVTDDALKQVCRERFWEILSGGEMDGDRAALCVTWWTTKGGRRFVMEGMPEDDPFVMSGGLGKER